MGKEDKRHREAHSSRELIANLASRARTALQGEPSVGGFNAEDYSAGKDTELSGFPQAGEIYECVDTVDPVASVRQQLADYSTGSFAEAQNHHGLSD